MASRSHPRPPIDPASLNGGSGATMWTNLGWWTGAGPYPAAAEELAKQVGRAAQLRAGDVVVDYACGFGDSLRVWIESFGVARVVGVEPDPAVTSLVTQRVAAWGLSERIHVRCGMAEDVAAQDAASDVSAVVCVDAAYHFASRAAWLAQIGKALPAGGRLGVADLAVISGAEGLWRMRALARLMRIPRGNLESAAQIESAMTGAGLDVHWSENAGRAVLDGFAAHAVAGEFSLELTRMVLRWARQQQLVDYRVIGAVKRSD